MTPPASVTGVVGMDRTVGDISPQTLNGTNYTFASWSDGGVAIHNLIWPAADTNLTLTYQVVPPVVLRIKSLVVAPDGQIHLTVLGPTNQTLTVQASTNLQAWNDLGTVQIPVESAEFVDGNATNHQHRYYGLRQF
jgi:hypothetical protein